jgi:hypothetical protein
MARNFSRSSSGIESSSASVSTRSLKSTQDSSRFTYSSVASRSGLPAPTAPAWLESVT